MDNRSEILNALLKGKIVNIAGIRFKFHQRSNGILNIDENIILSPLRFCARFCYNDYIIED